MKRTRQEKLYNQIMSNISKKLRPIIEAAMNEAEDDDVKSEIRKATDYLIKDGNIKDLNQAISMLKAMYRPNTPMANSLYKRDKFNNVKYLDIIAELERRVNDNKNLINDSMNNRRRIYRY